MYTDLTFSPHTSFGMGIKLALNFIWNGIKKALKSLEFHLEDPGGTLLLNIQRVHVSAYYKIEINYRSQSEVITSMNRKLLQEWWFKVGKQIH